MASWQKRARIGVAIFGIVVAIVVYAALGERQLASPPAPLERLDPKAMLESSRGVLRQVSETRKDYEIEFDHQLSYEGGATRLLGVRIVVNKSDGRDFVVTGREAQRTEARELQLSGEVRLVASDGFELTTASASFVEDDGVVRAPGAVSFEKGRMSGSGRDARYNQNTDVLGIGAEAHVLVAGEGGGTRMEFAAGAANFDRVQDLLTLDGGVHVVRDQQIMQADRALARLTGEEGTVSYVELRGNARVTGGAGSLESLIATDMDLYYSQDGETLERVVLAGGSAVAIASRTGGASRELASEALDVELAGDGSVTRALARENVRFDLPAAEGSPARSIRARLFEARGEEGLGLTEGTFSEDVHYREDGPPARTARSRTLRVSLADDRLRSATFLGSVTFDEPPLEAGAAQVQYDPEGGTLALTGTDAGGSPRVEDERITIRAGAIEVGLGDRHMRANGDVRTMLRPQAAGGRGGARQGARLPGLLRQQEPANVHARTLDYRESRGSASYAGSVRLWQGETAVFADQLVIDQEKGDLIATGSARSTIQLDGVSSDARAHELRYEDARRTVSYLSAPPPAGRGAPARGASADATTSAPGRGAVPAPPPMQPQFSGPQGDLRADRIDVVLAAEESRTERLEATGDVSLRITPSTSTGARARNATGARLTYVADDERYEMIGAAAVPVKVVEACRETTGKALTFFKSTDRIIVDGREETRTKTSGGPCPAGTSR